MIKEWEFVHLKVSIKSVRKSNTYQDKRIGLIGEK